MDMNDIALIAAGCVGILVAVFHGIVLQRKMIEPLLKRPENDAILAGPTRRLFPLLMHFSTLCWFLGGLVLIAAPFWFDDAARSATAIVVGAFYVVGAVGNGLTTRGKHPGWILLAIAVALIWFGSH
ncbi:MAG: hypothetical protein V3V03_09655 [Hyphomonadaceae bacterium]